MPAACRLTYGMAAVRPPSQLRVDGVPGEWFGLRFGDRGTHTSRTMMFAELSELFKFTEVAAEANDFRNRIVNENLLGKRTVATRKLTFQRLSEMYGLDTRVPIFRAFRQLWQADRAGRPLLAFLVAYARDPLLRVTTDTVLNTPLGSPVSAADFDDTLQGRLGVRLNPSVRHKVARNVGSSWTQSGHLVGRTAKRRAKAAAAPSTACLALLLGYATGLRGRALLTSEWVRLLDVSYGELIQLVQAANRTGLLNFRQVGDVMEIQFPTLIRPHEESLCHG